MSNSIVSKPSTTKALYNLFELLTPRLLAKKKPKPKNKRKQKKNKRKSETPEEPLDMPVRRESHEENPPSSDIDSDDETDEQKGKLHPKPDPNVKYHLLTIWFSVSFTLTFPIKCDDFNVVKDRMEVYIDYPHGPIHTRALFKLFYALATYALTKMENTELSTWIWVDSGVLQLICPFPGIPVEERQCSTQITSPPTPLGSTLSIQYNVSHSIRDPNKTPRGIWDVENPHAGRKPSFSAYLAKYWIRVRKSRGVYKLTPLIPEE